jgi:P27 family predicted phage terminase small subunit
MIGFLCNPILRFADIPMAQRGRKSAASLAILPIRRDEGLPIRPIPPAPPPEHLSGEMKRWWIAVEAKFELDDHHRYLLQAATESWDRMQQARQVIAENGISFADRFGNVRMRPEVRVENDAKLTFARLIRDLGLDYPRAEKDPGGIGWRR